MLLLRCISMYHRAKVLLQLFDVQQCELLEFRALMSNLHLYPTAAIQHRPLIHLYNHHTLVVSLSTHAQSFAAEQRDSQ